jgi:Mrp family chromosome partitioning ATPase
MSEFSDIPEGVSTLRHYLLTLWRRRWLVLVPLVVLPLVVFVASKRQSPMYEVFADVLVTPQEVATTSLIGQTPAIDDPNRTMATNAQLARVPALLTRVLRAQGLDGPATVFAANSFVYPVNDILRFGVDDEDPARAAALATEYARQFVAYRRRLDTAGLAGTLRDLGSRLTDLERQGRTGSGLYARLADRQQQLESILALRKSNVSLVRTATANQSEQIAPRPSRNASLGLAGGLVLGLVLAFLAETLSTKPRSPEEIEARLGLPLLARLGRTAEQPLAMDVAAADAFHRLRTSVELENRRVGARTVLVTDVADEDGRSAVVGWLGLALARARRSVALADFDLREGTLTRLFGLDDRRGITSLVSSGSDLDGAVVAVSVGGRDGPGDAARTLEILPSGPTVSSPLETLGSPDVSRCLSELAERFELVLVDAPGLLRSADASALSSLVDGVLVVVGASAKRPTLAEARRELESWPAAKLGFALDERRRTPTARWRRSWASARTATPVRASEQAS